MVSLLIMVAHIRLCVGIIKLKIESLKTLW